MTRSGTITKDMHRHDMFRYMYENRVEDKVVNKVYESYANTIYPYFSRIAHSYYGRRSVVMAVHISLKGEEHD